MKKWWPPLCNSTTEPYGYNDAGGGRGGGGNTLEVINIMQGMGSTIIQFLFKINWTNKSDMKEFFFTLKDLKESCCKRENF